MKKLLVLALVLGVAGFANAGLSLVKTGAEYQVVDVAGGTTSAGFFLVVTGGLKFDMSGSITQPGTSRQDVIYVYPSFDVAGVASMAGMYFIDGAIPGNPKPMYAPGLVIAQGIKYVSGEGTLSLYDNDAATGNPISSVTIVPEPITMLLLGLGGLLIRRK